LLTNAPWPFTPAPLMKKSSFTFAEKADWMSSVAPSSTIVSLPLPVAPNAPSTRALSRTVPCVTRVMPA